MGRPAEVQARAAALGVRLEGCEVRDPASDGALGAYAAHIVAGREKMSAGMAERMLRRPLYFAGAMGRPATRPPWWPEWRARRGG